MDYLVILGNRIRERRTALGISQAELAEAAGYSQKGMISRVEQGKVNITMDKVIKIADYLKVSVPDLLRDEPDRIVEPPQVIMEELNDEIRSELIGEMLTLLKQKEREQWQRQNGTENGGEYASASTVRSALSRVPLLDEEDAKMLSAVQEKAAASPSSALSERRGDGISKK